MFTKINSFLSVITLFHLLEAFQQNFVSVIGDNIEMKFSTNNKTFEDGVLTFISYNDCSQQLIVADGAVVLNKYKVEQKTAESLSVAVESVHFSDTGNYIYTFNRTTIAIVRVTVLGRQMNNKYVIIITVVHSISTLCLYRRD